MVTYRYDGVEHRLVDTQDYVVVRTRRRAPLKVEQVTPLSRSARSLAQQLEPVVVFPEAGVEVFRPHDVDRTAVTAALDAEDAVQFAGRGLHDDVSREPVVYTENLFVKLVGDAGEPALREIIATFGLRLKRPLPYASNAYFLEAPERTGQQVFDIAADLLAHPDVALCHPELVREAAYKALGDQWHLGRTFVGAHDIDDSANVRDAWLLRRGGGITIALIDDGVAVAHEEFDFPGKVVAARDVTRAMDGAAPAAGDAHGTACAGVACASGAHGASGVAPSARLMPIRLMSGLGSQAEADAFVWAADHGADVISCSWGPPDARWDDPADPRRNRQAPLPDSTRLAIDYAVDRGRQGRGCVVVWAAGNGNESVDYDGYASYEKVIAAGACNDSGGRSVYSDFGNALWCLFPSNDYAHDGHPSPRTPGIWTTDLPGNTGYNPGRDELGGSNGLYTNAFGGTSSAAPGVAGVAALILEEDPSLGWQDVKDIIRKSCVQIDSKAAKYGKDGHSTTYGHGRVDTLRAVQLARRPGAPVAAPAGAPRASMDYAIPYDPDFVGGGFRVPVPTPRCTGGLVASGQLFDYIHYSLVMHRDRRSALYVAHNVDASQIQVVSGASWSLDPRMEPAHQTGADAYANNEWDRGHLAMRQAVAWGPPDEAADASRASYFYTNAALQHERFNQDEWYALEEWVLEAAGGASPRMCVLTGPLYTVQDQTAGGFRVPSAFWKIIALRDPTASGQDLSVIGFVMKQNELWDDWNGGAIIDLQVYQVGVAEIGGYTGLDFGPLETLDEFEWRQARFRDRTMMRPIRITGPADIEFHGDRRRARGIRAFRSGPPDGEARAAAAPGAADPLAERVATLSRQTEDLHNAVEALLAVQRGDRARRDAAQAAGEARASYERIVGGVTVNPGEFPECACIGYGGAWFCSGVLVRPNVVLTAAHCAPEINQVFLGGRFLGQAGTTGELIEVTQAIIHPDYEPDRAPSHDIAVLILARDAATPPVEPAATYEVTAATDVQLVGFGYNHPTQAVGFGTKRKVTVGITQTQGMTDQQLHLTQITHGFDAAWEFHAGRKFLGLDSCNGDSGGPAYIRVGTATKVAGLTSRAAHSSVAPCGDGGIYTRIAPYWPWVQSVIGGQPRPVTATAPPPVYVSACLPNPAGPDRGNEWVELTNYGAAAADLGEFTLADNNGQQALQGPLSAGATRRIVIPADSAVKLANSGDEIVLTRGAVEVHRVSYTSAGSGQVITFDTPAVPALVYVSACLPNPGGTDAGNEWIEVTNAGGSAAALDAYALADTHAAARDDLHALAGTLDPGATLRVRLAAGSPIKLANARDEIILHRDGTEVQRERYEKAKSGQVITFDPPVLPDGGGDGPLADADPC